MSLAWLLIAGCAMGWPRGGYVCGAEGATRVTSEPCSARWLSPDELIVVGANARLYRLSRDGRSRRDLGVPWSDGTEPPAICALSPDARYVAISRLRETDQHHWRAWAGFVEVTTGRVAAQVWQRRAVPKFEASRYGGCVGVVWKEADPLRAVVSFVSDYEARSEAEGYFVTMTTGAVSPRPRLFGRESDVLKWTQAGLVVTTRTPGTAGYDTMLVPIDGSPARLVAEGAQGPSSATPDGWRDVCSDDGLTVLVKAKLDPQSLVRIVVAKPGASGQEQEMNLDGPANDGYSKVGLAQRRGERATVVLAQPVDGEQALAARVRGTVWLLEGRLGALAVVCKLPGYTYDSCSDNEDRWISPNGLHVFLDQE